MPEPDPPESSPASGASSPEPDEPPSSPEPEEPESPEPESSEPESPEPESSSFSLRSSSKALAGCGFVTAAAGITDTGSEERPISSPVIAFAAIAIPAAAAIPSTPNSTAVSASLALTRATVGGAG